MVVRRSMLVRKADSLGCQPDPPSNVIQKYRQALLGHCVVIAVWCCLGSQGGTPILGQDREVPR